MNPQTSDIPHVWIERAAGPEEGPAVEAAHKLWLHATERKPSPDLEDELRSLLQSPFDAVAFYASAALRLQLGPEAQEVILRGPLPDVNLERRHGSSPHREYSSNTPLHPQQAKRYEGPQEPRPARKPCLVCRGQRCTLVYSEHDGDGTSIFWMLEEIACPDCGAYTLYLKDD